jgi:hypothetical protein
MTKERKERGKCGKEVKFRPGLEMQRKRQEKRLLIYSRKQA